MDKEDEEAKGSLHLAKSPLTFLTPSFTFKNKQRRERERERMLIVVFATKVKTASLESTGKSIFVL